MMSIHSATACINAPGDNINNQTSALIPSASEFNAITPPSQHRQ
jgi:hypothetical protein